MIASGDVGSDLVLTLRAKSGATDRDPGFQVTLSNRSSSRTYPVVLSNDGSDVNWREPHVWFTVERRGLGGAWQAVSPQPIARCGLYAEDWARDVTLLGPGKEEILPWFTFDRDRFDYPGASEIRVTAHYAYGEHAKDPSKVPPSLQGMPAYTLSSAPVVVKVAHD